MLHVDHQELTLVLRLELSLELLVVEAPASATNSSFVFSLTIEGSYTARRYP
jgi:hypothetical protein